MKHALITVVVPVYNVAPYLEKCIESIQDQTYGNLEILLVDDGSTDGSGEICDKYAKKDRRIKVIHKKNGGLVTARKAGLACAQGEYIGFVDADDFIDSEFYEWLWTRMQDTDADITQMGYWEEKGTGSRKVGCLPYVYDIAGQRMALLCEGFFKREMQGFWIFYNVWSKLYKSDVIKFCYSKVPDIQPFGEDVICTCHCMLHCNRIATMEGEKYHYNVRHDSISNEKSLDYFVKLGNLYVQLDHIFRAHNQYLRIKNSIDIFYKERILIGLNMFGAEVCRYIFPKTDILQGKNIILYGAGSVGKDYYTQFCRYRKCHVVALMDKNFSQYHYGYVDVIGKDRLPDLEYDLILISVQRENVACSIKEDLIGAGVPEEVIIWEKPICNF